MTTANVLNLAQTGPLLINGTKLGISLQLVQDMSTLRKQMVWGSTTIYNQRTTFILVWLELHQKIDNHHGPRNSELLSNRHHRRNTTELFIIFYHYRLDKMQTKSVLYTKTVRNVGPGNSTYNSDLLVPSNTIMNVTPSGADIHGG